MTWAEFKKQVEAAGVEDGDEIDYIDIDSTSEVDVIRRTHFDTTSFSVLSI